MIEERMLNDVRERIRNMKAEVSGLRRESRDAQMKAEVIEDKAISLECLADAWAKQSKMGGKDQ